MNGRSLSCASANVVHALDTIGGSPLIGLRHLIGARDAAVLVKLERCNPDGNVKDRPAWYVVRRTEEGGALLPGGTITESSSGNFGTSLVMSGTARGHRVVIIVDPKATTTNLAMLRAIGAALCVALWLAGQYGMGRRVALIASGSGERYLNTIYDDAWLTEHGLRLDISPAEHHLRPGRGQ